MPEATEVLEWRDRTAVDAGGEKLGTIEEIYLDAETPTFAFKGNIASFNPSKRAVSIMFHRGAEIPGHHPRLEGDGKLVRTMRFPGLDELEDGRADLEAVVRAWCDWKAG